MEPEKIEFRNFRGTMQVIIDTYQKRQHDCLPHSGGLADLIKFKACAVFNPASGNVEKKYHLHFHTPTMVGFIPFYLCVIKDWQIVSELIIELIYFNKDEYSVEEIFSITFRNYSKPIFINTGIFHDTVTKYYVSNNLGFDNIKDSIAGRQFIGEIKKMKAQIEIEYRAQLEVEHRERIEAKRREKMRKKYAAWSPDPPAYPSRDSDSEEDIDSLPEGLDDASGDDSKEIRYLLQQLLRKLDSSKMLQ